MKYITEKTLKEEGFIKRANMWMKNGFALSLIKGHTWILSKAKCQEKDVDTIEDIREHMNSPIEHKSSKVAY